MDTLQSFSFDGTPVRGELVQLKQSYQTVLDLQHYPSEVASLLGKLMAASALLSSRLKVPGRLSLQLRMKGVISLIQSEVTNKGEIRAIARYDKKAVLDKLDELQGHLVITLEPDNGQRYQGISEFKQGDVALALKEYFIHSEQLDSEFHLEADGQIAAGLMLQKMPAQKEDDPDAWNRLNHLANTLKQEELLNLPKQDILVRLFHEEPIRVYPEKELQFICSCSKARLSKALSSVGYDEINALLKERERIEVNCEFCQQRYLFYAQDMHEIFPESSLH